jgi:hypothetical protein
MDRYAGRRVCFYLTRPTVHSHNTKHNEKIPGSISSGAILSLNEDEKGNLWVGN